MRHFIDTTKLRLRIPLRYWIAASVPVLLTAIGTVGYRIIEPEYTWFDAFYMTGITLTTVGFGEVKPLSPTGRLFTLFLCYSGVFTLFYTATAIIRAVVSGEIRDTFGKARMKHTLDNLDGHIIVCGLGRMGRLICNELDNAKVPFVVIDTDMDTIRTFNTHYGIPVPGDATSDEILKLAGVERAKSLITALPADTMNLYITLSAKTINPKLHVVARSEDESATAKLKRVGANVVVSPYVLGGHVVAQAVLRPNVREFLSGVTRIGGSTEFQIEEVSVDANSEICGKNLRDTDLHKELGIVVLTMKNPNQQTIYNPQADAVIEAGCAMVVVGHRDQLGILEERLKKG